MIQLGMHLTEEHRKNISKRFKGKKRSRESIEKMLETKRRNNTLKTSEETKKKLSDISKNKVYVHKDSVQKRINREELADYLNDGWIRGTTEERNKNVSKSKMGDKNPMYGRKWDEKSIEKMLETKKKNDTLKHSEETRQKLAELNKRKAKDPEFRKKLSDALMGKNTWSKGRVFIKKDLKETIIDKENLEKYINDGWILGRLTKNERMRLREGKEGLGNQQQVV